MFKRFHISFPKFRFKKRVMALFWLIAIIGVMAFVDKKQADRVCEKVEVSIDNQHQNYFIEEEDVQNLLSDGGKEQLTGELHSYLKLKQLELRVRNHGFVQDVQVYTDLKGNLRADVVQCKPLVRLSNPGGEDVYVSTEGRILPLSNRYTARVPIISGDFVRKLLRRDWKTDTLAKPYFELVNRLREDKFYNTMFPQISINYKGEVVLYPQVGSMEIEFGTPTDIDTKFYKLQILYKDILPAKGWATYTRASIKFENQIICE